MDNEKLLILHMLIRVLEEIDYQSPDIVLDDDIKSWWKHTKIEMENN